ncbi:pyridoxamine 5'-phosphate oxidase family protein [Metabacillus iocasae]|uniref:pyridoxamine 5'-phosphate oxidase family protein n=1 Tax=Priestia iocasae TaxID=2291674 RepID=UPI00196456F7|nr:pyridoxamine 5'-phosphate oxidase family protein [Metabacillus iocasae]
MNFQYKAEEIEQNPYVHILLGYNGEGFRDSYIEVEGKVIIKEDDNLKQQIWQESFSRWFDGPNDSDYIVLEIHPSAIRLMNKSNESPQVLTL